MEDKNKNNSKWYYLAFTIIVLICVAVIVASILNNNKTKKDDINISYTDLINKIDNREVEKIEMTVRKYFYKSKIKRSRRRKACNNTKYTGFY